MASYQGEENARLKRQKAREAINLALQSRWQEAEKVNREIIERFPTDVDAYNRLGKALTELGNYTEAKQAYAKGLEIDPNNTIARKNLNRLSQLKEGTKAPPVDKPPKFAPRLFIEETGKTGTSSLYNPAPREVLAKMAAGDQVYLKILGRRLVVENAESEYLGEVEPKLGLRLINLMEGGNEYAAAIASINESRCTIIIKETFQHPSQAGKPSFPTRGAETFRPYIKEGILRYELEEEEAEETEGQGEWEEHAGLEGEEISLNVAIREEEKAGEEEEEGE